MRVLWITLLAALPAFAQDIDIAVRPDAVYVEAAGGIAAQGAGDARAGAGFECAYERVDLATWVFLWVFHSRAGRGGH